MTEESFIKIIKALSDINRLRIFRTVQKNKVLSCGEIVKMFSLSQATVSHHLKILTDAQLFDVRREGQHGFFSVNVKIFHEFQETIANELTVLTSSTKISA